MRRTDHQLANPNQIANPKFSALRHHDAAHRRTVAGLSVCALGLPDHSAQLRDVKEAAGTRIQMLFIPPSTRSDAPVMCLASSDARNTAAGAILAGSASIDKDRLRSGVACSHSC